MRAVFPFVAFYCNNVNHLITLVSDSVVGVAVDIGCPKHEGKHTLIPFSHINQPPPPSFLSGSDSHYAIVHGTHPIAKQGEGIFPDGDEIVIFDADAVLPQVTVRLKTPNNV